MSTLALPRRHREFVKKYWRFKWHFDATGVTVTTKDDQFIAREEGL